jgi:hypothetical protein
MMWFSERQQNGLAGRGFPSMVLWRVRRPSTGCVGPMATLAWMRLLIVWILTSAKAILALQMERALMLALVW